MKLTTKSIFKKDLPVIKENVKQAKQYVDVGKLSQDILKSLIEIDPTTTRKFVGWMAKQWVAKTVTDIDDLRNNIEEYNTFLEKGKAKTKDINQFKTFKDLANEVDTINKTGEAVSLKDLESDYETIVDNSELLIMVPHTHEASRKLGLTRFSFRDCGDGTKDSAWCTTYKAPDHFNDYYYKHNVTFYYVLVKSQELIDNLIKTFPQRGKAMIVTALALLDSGQMDAYDGKDRQLSKNEIQRFLDITGIS